MLLKGKNIVATGVATGIGQGTALVLAREGANLLLCDLSVEAMAETLALVQPYGGHYHCLQVDVSKKENIENMVAKAVELFGSLDGAFNNAGISGATAPLDEYPDEDFERVMDTNLRSIWWSLKSQINVMMGQETKGAIVNTASVGAIVGKPGISAYIASKHAVSGLTKNAALEYGKFGVRVNAVCPGVIRTPMLDSLIKSGKVGSEADWNAIQPIGRLGTTEEIGEAVAWLLSDRSSLIHGQSIVLDGGFTVS
ncbi:SDR family NAD(P)-dependent oxidoreductase [Sphingobacterium sp. MYb382]|uniref:SDR family NAD(P)-dependent oxidoreductase n=1 Tax=Sphingobacterium sp. MYb382 TaxID=2745278 RepID=UPI00309B2AAD